jgi:GNAT superfamily N-acetyltransferase
MIEQVKACIHPRQAQRCPFARHPALSFLPGLARRGALRAQIEAVRVREDYRGRRLGEALVTWAIDEGRRRGCALVQLTSDKSRHDAHRFYERLGFAASHEGMKLAL